MFRRWLRGCLLPSALCLSVVGCTTSVESLTGGLITTGGPAPKSLTDPSAVHTSNELATGDQLRLHLDTARQMDKAGDDRGALEEYERVLLLDSSNLSAMRRLCVLYDRRGDRDDFKKAEELYRKVAAARPNDPDVWSDWGYSLFLRTDKETCQANWAEAEKKLRQALKLDPQHTRAHTNLGLVLGQLGRYDEAYREFKAAQLSDAEAHCDMAFLYWQKGRLEDAKQECRIAREKDPTLAKAKDMLATLEHPAKPRDKDGHRDVARNSAREEAEHEFARRTLAGMSAGTPAAAPLPPVAPPSAAPAWQSSEPIVMPSGSRWMPVHSGQAPAPTAPAPAAPATVPPTVGTPGTITLD